MDANYLALKKVSKIAFAALGVLLIGAIVFYRERLFADTSYIAFNIINYKSVFIQNQRYGSFITQIVPFLGQKMHLSLKANLIGYSISFNCFFFAAAAVLIYKCRQYSIAIIMALYYFLIVSDSYFLANDEIHQAVAWMFLMFGVTNYLAGKKVNFLLLAFPFLVLATLTLFTHFIVIIPTVFILVYLLIEKNNWPFSKNHSIILVTLLAAIIGVKFAITSGSQPYEKKHLYNITHFSIKDIIDSFSTPVVGMFLSRCVTNYWLAVLIFVAGLGSLVRQKQYALAAWTFFSCLGYFILMGMTYSEEPKDILLFHIETEWQCLGILIAVPFVLSFLYRLKSSHAMICLAFIFAVRLSYIASAIPAFSWRTRFHEKVLAEMKKKNINKLAIYADKALENKYMLYWAAGYESLFASAMDGDQPQRTFVFVYRDDKQKLEALTNKKIVFLYDASPIDQLNDTYFKVDTTTPYSIMTYEELSK